MWSRIVEENVDYQVLLATKKYEEEVKNHKLVIIGLVDDLTNVYKSGKGRTIIVNINNITKTNKLKLNPVMNTMSKEIKDIFILTSLRILVFKSFLPFATSNSINPELKAVFESHDNNIAGSKSIPVFLLAIQIPSFK